MSEVSEEVSEVSQESEEKNGAENEESKENDITFYIDEAFGVLGSKLDGLKEQFGILEAEFKSKIKYDGHKEKIINDLHREVQEYKNDLIKNFLRPIIMDTIHTIDDITKLVDNYDSKDSLELDPLKLVKQMKGIASDLEDILFRQGVESFNCEQLEFEPKQQKIIKTEITDDQSKDKTISRRVHNGYKWEENVLRREMVDVYVYKPEFSNPEINKNNEEIKNDE